MLRALLVASLLLSAPVALAGAPAVDLADATQQECNIVDVHCYDPNSRIPDCLVYVVLFCIPEPRA